MSQTGFPRTAPRHAEPGTSHSRRWPKAAALLLAAACGAGDSDGPVPPDPNPSLDQWCGNRPCGWDLDMGLVKRVSTWHQHDYAVEFGGPSDAQLSQVQPSTPAPCLVFDIVTRMDADARLVLRVDFNQDGQIDWSQSASALAWKSVPFSIPTPTFYDEVRFIMRKEGAGRAVVAQIVISGEDQCPGFPLLLAAGSRCEDDSVCEEGLTCSSGICKRAEAVRLTTGSE